MVKIGFRFGQRNKNKTLPEQGLCLDQSKERRGQRWRRCRWQPGRRRRRPRRARPASADRRLGCLRTLPGQDLPIWIWEAFQEFCIICIYFDVTTWEMPLRQASTPCRIGRRIFGLFAIIFRNRWHSPHRSPIWGLSFSDDMFSSIIHIFFGHGRGFGCHGNAVGVTCEDFLSWIGQEPFSLTCSISHEEKPAAAWVRGECLKTYGALHVHS